MFGLCRDPLVAELQNLGFSLVPLADASIRPLELLGRQGKELFRFGELSCPASAPMRQKGQIEIGRIFGPS